MLMALSEESQAEFRKFFSLAPRDVCQIGLDFYLHNFLMYFYITLLSNKKNVKREKRRIEMLKVLYHFHLIPIKKYLIVV